MDARMVTTYRPEVMGLFLPDAAHPSVAKYVFFHVVYATLGYALRLTLSPEFIKIKVSNIKRVDASIHLIGQTTNKT